MHTKMARSAFLSPGQLQPEYRKLCVLVQGKKERKKKDQAASMGLLLFGLETAKAQETLTDKYLAPLCLTYLGVALDTMSTNASSVLRSRPFPPCPRDFFML